MIRRFARAVPLLDAAQRDHSLELVADLVGIESAARLFVKATPPEPRPDDPADTTPRPSTPGSRISRLAHRYPVGG